MYPLIFGEKQNNMLNKIINLTSTVLLDSKKMSTLLADQKQHADAIYEMLLLLKTKGQQNRSQDWINETFYYCADADVYTLLSSGNIISTLKNARLLNLTILPVLREKNYFSQQDFDTTVKQAIAKDIIDNPEETISPLMEEDEEMAFLLKKRN